MTNEILDYYKMSNEISNAIICGKFNDPRRLQALGYIDGAMTALLRLSDNQDIHLKLKWLLQDYYNQGMKLIKADTYEDATKIEVNT